MGGEDCDIDSVPTNCYVYDSITGCYVEDGYYLTGAGDFIIQVEDGMLIIPDVCFCFTTTTTTTLEVTTTTTTTCEECCYGLLYNWYTVDTGDLAPSGWHVPSDTEWTTLSTYLGGDSVAGGKMKSICCWTEPNEATNESMFTAFPDGCRTYEGYFDQINLFGNWWSSTEYSSENVWYRNIFCNNTILNRPYAYKNYGFNIRCLLDGVDPTDPGSVTDIDGNIYPTVKIGTQVWMAENLKVTRLNDGTPIPEITDDTEWAGMTTMALCAYNNDWDNVCIPQPTTTTTSTTCYFCLGMQYNWYAVNNSNGLAPEGWHIPSKTEFETLLNSIDTYDPDLGYWPLAGGKLKDFCGWSPNIGATNETGWSGYGGGQRQIVGVGPFFTVTWGYEELGEWWTSTEVYSSNAWNLVLSYSGPITHLYNDSRKGWGVSVRCIRDTSEGWIEGETVEDYDGNIYHTVQIGTQIWMVEDLTTSHYKNGVSINYYPADVDWCYDTDGAFCVYNNNWNYACIDEITTTTTTTTSP
jgi:uncharacterized protein (TIGR02145 family)